LGWKDASYFRFSESPFYSPFAAKTGLPYPGFEAKGDEPALRRFQPPPPNPPENSVVNIPIWLQVDWGTPPDPGGETFVL